MAKGIRRSRSRLGGRLEFGNEVALTMHRGRSLDVISSAEILIEHWRALVQPERLATAAAACEMVDAFSEPDLSMPEVYVLLAGMLAAVAKSDAPSGLVARFSLRLLEELGLAPPLEACVQCGRTLEGERVWLDPIAGGFVDAACRGGSASLELDVTELENFRALAAPRDRSEARLRATRRASDAAELLVAHHLGRRPKALVSLAEIR